MNKRHTPIGLKRNLDKILFILATGYLIAVAAWLIRQEKLKSLVVLNNSTEDLPSLENKSNQEPLLELKEEVEGETTTKSDLYSIIHQPIAQLSNSPSITSIAPHTLVSPSPLPLLSPPLLKVPIPPLPKLQPPSKLTLVPVLDSKNNNMAFAPSHPHPQTNSQANCMLVGLIELGDVSAALFKIDDLTQKVKLGEEIGSSGWILVSITGKRAEINRQGESLYLTVGEKF